MSPPDSNLLSGEPISVAAERTQVLPAPPARVFARPVRFRWAIFLLIALAALAVRIPRLAERPMHTDESVNAYIVGQLLSGEVYRYDGRDRHGPALCALAIPLARATGAHRFADLDEFTLRLIPVVVGALAVLLFASIAHETGTIAATTAALLWAFAPLPLYYSRYFIHETLFAAATLGLISFGWRALDIGSRRYGIAAGACAGTMLACKETALLHYAAVGLAGLVWLFDARHVRTEIPGRTPFRWGPVFRALACAGVSWALFLLVIYTWGFRHWQGPLDLIESFPRFLHRATGEGHEKPAWYYARLLLDGRSGPVALALALLGAVSIGRKAAHPARLDPESPHGPNSSITLRLFLVYAGAICVIYTLIPYKTPWLALNLWLPLSVLAGCGCSALWRGTRAPVGRAGLMIAALALLLALGWDARLRVFVKASDERNPYAYAHTVEDLLRLPPILESAGAKRGVGAGLRIAVVASDAWPLPWYLRRFPNTGFWQPGKDPGTADVYIASMEAAEGLAKYTGNKRPEFIGIRPDVLAILWAEDLQ